MTEERSFFFRTENRPLYGRLYTPDGTGNGVERGMDSTANSGATSAGRRGLVICDSLFEEKFWCERVVSRLARRLAAAGWTVLTFDIYGYGNSGGDSADVTLTSIYEDIGAACDLIRGKGVDIVSLLGLRWGALPACEVAARREDVDSIFLVNPVRKWKKQFMKALRANVAGQYAIFKKVVMTREKIIEELLAGGDCVRAGYRMNNIDGYLISKEFFEEVSDAAFPDALPGNISKAAVITIPEKQASSKASVDPLVETWNFAGADCEDIFIADDNAFWINNRIFTSDTPEFFSVMERLLGSAGDIPSGTRGGVPTIAESPSCVIDGVREEAVTVTSPDGYELCGVTYMPEGGSGEVDAGSDEAKAGLRMPEGGAWNEGFVFTHGGLIGMNGAFRFNTRAARRLARSGYPAICCDTHGMGRSGGSIENQEQRVLFRDICAGLFAGDVHSAALYLKEKASVEKVALFGVCGGAITNILSHSTYEDIDESILLSVPVMLPSLDYGEVRMSEGFAKFYLGLYLRKIFNPVAWYRFITGKSETDKIGKSLNVALGGMIRKLSGGGRKTGTDVAAKKEVRGGLSVSVPGAGDLQFNRGFLDAYSRITGRDGRVYFIFGEHDNFKYEFNSEFVDAMPEEYQAGIEAITVEEITHANHMYTLREWQDIIIDKCMTWIALD
ncbi:MAG: alpha/beta hydrolase [Candidatus Krumholzibacteria bacterium]|nr:alpha/beta hydrolase [Candidatus Krumholzibacteria bacterium]